MMTERNKYTAESGISGADRYLSRYLTLYRMLYAEGYGKEDPATAGIPGGGLSPEDGDAFCSEVKEIRRVVLDVPDPKEKVFLFQHYLRGRTVESCAELLDISVRTAYRLKKRALGTVARRLGA